VVLTGAGNALGVVGVADLAGVARHASGSAAPTNTATLAISWALSERSTSQRSERDDFGEHSC